MSILSHSRRGRAVALAIAALLTAVAVRPGVAVLLDGDEGDRNHERPVDDPGFAHVGNRGGASAVYLGDGWVITAKHIGPGSVRLAGRVHALVAGSPVALANRDRKAVDLVVFRVTPEPDLEPLRIRREPPVANAQVVLVGRGHDRGAPVRWQGHAGYRWAANNTMRWGTNRVHEVRSDFSYSNTRLFSTRFSLAASPHEAQAVVGDSGGAVFHRGDDGWELAGIMLVIDSYPNQPPRTSFYGNRTYHADLSAYADEIDQIMASDYVSAAPAGPDGDPRR